MKQVIETSNAPAPVGPYNQAIRISDLLFVSGQIALGPHTGDLQDTTIEEETDRVMKNLSAILHTAGVTMEHVVKCTVFVKNMNQYQRTNEVYATYFDEAKAPARELVEVANLPKSANVEISVIAGLTN